jgi:hypothetical protein
MIWGCLQFTPGNVIRSKLTISEEGHCFRDQALSFCNMKSSLPRDMLDASSLSTPVQMVSAGMNVTLIPEIAMAVEARSASVSVARFKNPQPSRTIGMIWRKIKVRWPDSSCNFLKWFVVQPTCCGSSTMRRRHCAIAGAKRHSPRKCRGQFLALGLARRRASLCSRAKYLATPSVTSIGLSYSTTANRHLLTAVGAAGDVPARCHNSFSVMQVPLRIGSGSYFRFI